MADTAFINSATYESASSNSAVVSKPVDTADDDILFALINRYISADPTSIPEGWILLGKYYNTTFDYGWWLYYKIASSEGASYTWGWATAVRTKVTIATYRGGFNTSDPIDAFSNTEYIVNNTTVRAASMSVTNVGSTLLYLGSVHKISVTSFTKPTTQDNDWAEDYDAGSTDPDFWQTIGHCNWSGSGASGVIDITAALTSTVKHAFAVALNIAVAGEDIFKIINEVVNIGESKNKLLSLLRVKNEVVNLAENQNRIRGRLRIHNDTINISEAKNYIRGRLRIINEILNIGELKNYKRTLLRIINEALHISELKNKLMTLVRIKNEVINIGESFIKFIGGKIVKVINEIINISEAKNKLMTLLRIKSETVNIVELKNTAKKIIRVINETVHIVENIVKRIGLVIIQIPQGLKRIIILIRDRK